MSVAFPEIRVGDPIRHEALAVFPLFASQATPWTTTFPTRPSQRQRHRGRGLRSWLRSRFGGREQWRLRVLFLEGEELVGAKQNRILNTSVLIAAHTKSKIPVSCVEAGRWGYKTAISARAGRILHRCSDEN